MPGMDGLATLRALVGQHNNLDCIMMTAYGTIRSAVEAMRSGASGYLVKTCAASDLLDAIQAAIKGKSYVTPKIARGMREAFIQNPEAKSPEKELTPRQGEVIQLLAEGKSMKEAADILKVSPRTIAFHKYEIMKELGIKTNAELIRVGIKKSILVA